MDWKNSSRKYRKKYSQKADKNGSLKNKGITTQKRTKNEPPNTYQKRS